jgi:hypothetical protein
MYISVKFYVVLIKTAVGFSDISVYNPPGGKNMKLS